MKSKIMIILGAAAALVGCEQRQDRMNEPAGAERPAYENPSVSTNKSSIATNQPGNSEAKTNGANSPGTGTSAAP
jgi:hypothetical protein